MERLEYEPDTPATQACPFSVVQQLCVLSIKEVAASAWMIQSADDV